MPQPAVEMTAEDVLEMLALLDANHIETWLEGGWNVDALLGEQTRFHKDLDLVVALMDVPGMLDLLAEHGFELIQGRPPTNFVLQDEHCRQLDFHPVTWDEYGNGIYRMENGEDWPFPEAGFAGRGVIAGHAVKCLTPEILMLCRAGYEWADKDYRDTAAIHARFSVPYPPGYSPERQSQGPTPGDL